MERHLDKLEAPSYSCEKITPANKEVRCLISSPYEYTVTYINGFNDSMAVIERNGVKTICPPQRDRNNVNFIIRQTYSVPKAVKFDADNILVSDPDITIECAVINKASEKLLSDDNMFSDHRTFAIDFIISRDVLERRGGSLYLIERDVVISNRIGSRSPTHPFSKHHIKQKLIDEDNNLVNENVFGFSIRIVDNNGTYGDRYINLNNKAYRIPARRDRILHDGVYYTCTGQAFGNYDLCPPETHKYSFDEADKVLNLYRSVEDALSFGDPIKAKEKELEKIKMEHKEKELEYANDKLEKQRKIDELTAEVKLKETDYKDLIARMDFMRKELEHAAKMKSLSASDHYEHKSLYRKDEFEDRNFRRKDWTENMKYVPHVIAAIAGSYIAWQKIKNPDSK